MEFSPNHWIGVFQLGMALFALVGGLILFVGLILIGLYQPTIPKEEFLIGLNQPTLPEEEEEDDQSLR